MKVLALGALGALLLGQAAAASPTWTLISFSAKPQDAAAIAAAADALMASPAGQKFPGRLLLQVHVADGENPATHSFVPIYRSAAEREPFVQALQADPAWGTFEKEMTRLSQPVSTAVYRTLASYGDLSDDDRVWETHAFRVSDPRAFAAAIEAFLASETGKGFEGQVHLSATLAGGLSPVTHVVSVGFASDAESERWMDGLDESADWARYLEASRKVAEHLGTSRARDLRNWGKTPIAELAAK